MSTTTYIKSNDGSTTLYDISMQYPEEYYIPMGIYYGDYVGGVVGIYGEYEHIYSGKIHYTLYYSLADYSGLSTVANASVGNVPLGTNIHSDLYDEIYYVVDDTPTPTGTSTCTISYNSQTLATTEESSPVNITYNGSTIASSVTGTKTIECAGTVMASDLVVGSKTLLCQGKLMSNDVIVTVESGSSGETWVIDEEPNRCQSTTYTVDFTSKGIEYNTFSFYFSSGTESGGWEIFKIIYGLTRVYSEATGSAPPGEGWLNQAYRTITLTEPATGDLLIWLTANAVKQ